MIYTVFMNDEKPAGGMISIDKTCGGVPPNWIVYFAVNDCDSSAASAKSMGGETLSAPMDIPCVGIIAVLKDSQSAAFAIIKLVQM